MSSYWTVACKTCKKSVDLAGYTDEFVIKFTGEFMRYYHICHEVVLFSDITDEDGEFSEMISDYETEEASE